MESVELQPIKVAAREEGSGMLVLVGGWLVAVLVRLSDQHGSLSGHWFLETGYGRLAETEQVTFGDLSSAAEWFAGHLADRSPSDEWEREH